MNPYATLQDLKTAGSLSISGTTADRRLMQLAADVSRMIDGIVDRHFYELAMTKTFDGDGTIEQLLDDLISIDTDGLKTDDNIDRTFETTWATTDYLLLPSNADPTSRNNGRSRPYWKLEVDPAGNEDIFTRGRQTVQIAGKWGFWRHLKWATETYASVQKDIFDNATATVESIREDIQPGHTILIDDEQMYVKDVSGTELFVERAVNGTLIATHAAENIWIYEYPPQIVEATIIQTSRIWRRRESSFANAVGFPDGTTQLFTGLDPDVKEMLFPFRRFAF